jgi:hypothetical protein
MVARTAFDSSTVANSGSSPPQISGSHADSTIRSGPTASPVRKPSRSDRPILFAGSLADIRLASRSASSTGGLGWAFLAMWSVLLSRSLRMLELYMWIASDRSGRPPRRDPKRRPLGVNRMLTLKKTLDQIAEAIAMDKRGDLHNDVGRYRPLH